MNEARLCPENAQTDVVLNKAAINKATTFIVTDIASSRVSIETSSNFGWESDPAEGQVVVEGRMAEDRNERIRELMVEDWQRKLRSDEANFPHRVEMSKVQYLPQYDLQHICRIPKNFQR